jgi:alpha-mannosidase
VIQVLEGPGIVGPLVQSVFLPVKAGDGSDYLEFESWWIMGQTTHPEATYLLFPFNVRSAQVRIDLGGQAMVAGQDQIPGVCYDYYTAQQWVDLSNNDLGITIALPDNPMVQFGNFHFGDNQSKFEIDRALLLGWITNTYWETNFRTHQPGGVHARYRVYPHAGGFDPIAAQRRGLETAASQPLLQHMGEPDAHAKTRVYPASGSLLRLPEALEPGRPVFTLHVKPARKGTGIVVRLYNAGDEPQTARIDSGLLRIQSAELCDLAENAVQAVEVRDGGATMTLPSRQVTTVRLEVEQ